MDFWICHTINIYAICFGFPAIVTAGIAPAIKVNDLHLFAAHIASIRASARNLFPGLHERAMATRALQQFEKAEYAGGE
jgi:hypothetical protein